MTSAAIAPQPSSGLVDPPAKALDQARLRRTAEDFEAAFLAQMLSTMTENMTAGGNADGGPGAGAYGDMLNQEMAKLISRSGGIGVADSVLQEMLKMQEMA